MSVALDPDILLTARDLAQRWGMTPVAVRAMRYRGAGPEFICLSERRYRYRLATVIEFERNSKRRAETRAASPEAEAKAAKQRASMAKARKAHQVKRAKRRTAR
jgi:hypothetical protein